MIVLKLEGARGQGCGFVLIWGKIAKEGTKEAYRKKSYRGIFLLVL